MKKLIVSLSTVFALSLGFSSQTIANEFQDSVSSAEPIKVNVAFLGNWRERIAKYRRDRNRTIKPVPVKTIDKKLERAKNSVELKKDLKRKADGKQAKVRKSRNSRMEDRTAGMYDEKRKNKFKKLKDEKSKKR